jgi:hypothetical protein
VYNRERLQLVFRSAVEQQSGAPCPPLADAWPLVHPPTDWDAWGELLVSGQETLQPRMTAVPVRLPFPVASKQGSIYENQADLNQRYFDVAQ